MGPSHASTGPKRHRKPSIMSDAALEFIEQRGLGKVLGRIRLDSGIEVPGGARLKASLVLSSSGLWLVAARDRTQGQHLDLLTRGDLRLVSGRLRDQLCFGQECLTIPAGRRSAVERLIALARLGVGAEKLREQERSRLVHETDELGRAWLRRELEPGEVLIAWLRGGNTLSVRSQLLDGEHAPAHPYFLVTDRRAGLVAWSSVGDVSYAPLSSGHARLQKNEDDKLELDANDSRFVCRKSDTEAVRDAFELLTFDDGKARLLEAARRTWLARHAGRGEVARAMALLDVAAEKGSQRALFARLLAKAEAQGAAAPLDKQVVLRSLEPGRLTPVGLGDTWSAFQFSTDAGSALVRALLDSGDEARPFALALQRRVHATPGADEPSARAELRLARYAVETRLQSAATADARDQSVLQVLAPRGLAADPVTPREVQSPLSSELVDDVLRHPLAREKGSLVATAQRLIAQTPEPDVTALSDYCEALDAREQPAAKRALDAARLALALPKLQAYVSRGKKSIGLRGYEGKPPYILLGKAHLDPESPYHMSEAELCFAIGAEAMHLRLGQTRLTSSDVWAGAFARTKGGVELALSLLPLAKGLSVAVPLGKFLDKVPEPALRKGLEALARLDWTRSRAPDLAAPASALSHINENLFAAHRLMQMSADRAGLVLTGDLRSGLRALLLVRPDTRELLDLMLHSDLVSVLLNIHDDDALRADLIVRIAALLGFYTSDDYLTLRRAL